MGRVAPICFQRKRRDSMRFLSSAQFIERSRVADEFVATSAALANRLLAARSLGHLPPCSVSYFIEGLWCMDTQKCHTQNPVKSTV